MSTEKDLNYWKANAEEDYKQVPISVLRYIIELETAVKNCSIPDVSKSFEIGEKVLHKTTIEVFISDYCEDVEQIEVCCGADYYKVDIDSLAKI